MTLRCAMWIGCSLLWKLPSAYACDCIGASVAAEFERADAVFLGKVVLKKEVHRGTSDPRRRYEVHFRVTGLWKGPDQREIVLRDPGGPTGCDNYGFESGKEYIVFAKEHPVFGDFTLRTDDGIDVVLQDTWSDVIRIGSKILAVQLCTHTKKSSTPGFRHSIAELGPLLARPVK